MSRSLSVSVAMALGGLVLVGTGSAYAQSSESVRAKVPFDFKVGQATLPAGEYNLKYDPADARGVLTVRSADGHHEAFVLTEAVDARKGTPNPTSSCSSGRGRATCCPRSSPTTRASGSRSWGLIPLIEL